MASYATPGFSWALPEQQEPSPATTKLLVNPLLKQSFLSPPSSIATDFRVLFSPVENVGIRQRRQQESSFPNNRDAAARKPVRPPTASFLSNGSISNGFSTLATVSSIKFDSLTPTPLTHYIASILSLRLSSSRIRLHSKRSVETQQSLYHGL